MRRRDFMARSIGASLAAYLGVSGATAAEKDSEKQRASGKLSALNPVSKYARSYVPPERAFDPSRPQSLEFDIIGWKTDKGRQIVSTPVLGQIVVTRRPSSDAVEYEVVQDLAGREKMKGGFRCLADPTRSLLSWQFEHTLSPSRKITAGMSRTRQSGKRQGGKIAMVTNGTETVATSSSPLLCRWGLMDVASRMADLCRAQDRYTVLHEPSGLRPDQRFREDQRVSWVAGKTPP